MRRVQGFAAAREALARRGFGTVELPGPVQARIRAVFGADLTAEEVVRRIVADVRAQGDAALRDYARRIDGIELTSVEVGPGEIQAAYKATDPELVAALRLVRDRIAAFHERHRRQSWVDFAEGGLGQIVQPLRRVGVYAPGGSAAYPSSVLMTAVPAKVAGVEEVFLCTPPGRATPAAAAILVAADIAGIDRVFRIGGAQAIAAFAYGTETIPPVDKIFGPGNVFVTLAKREVYGAVGIDGLYGPTETFVVADDSADPVHCAADLIAQAEHDVLAQAVFATTSATLAGQVEAEVARQLATLPRREIAGASLETNGVVATVESLDEAIDLANAYAPEHLCLLVREPWRWVGKVRSAGGVFLGDQSLEAIGDYVAGPSHVMPTSGTARFSSPLSLNDFVKITSLIAIDRATLEKIGPAAVRVAEVEGLHGHARSIQARLENSVPSSSSPLRGERRKKEERGPK